MQMTVVQPNAKLIKSALIKAKEGDDASREMDFLQPHICQYLCFIGCIATSRLSSTPNAGALQTRLLRR
jgi:hypothetical protein